jgi:hypothetical protein
MNKQSKQATILDSRDIVQIWRYGQHRVYKNITKASRERLYCIEESDTRSHSSPHGFVAYWK